MKTSGWCWHHRTTIDGVCMRARRKLVWEEFYYVTRSLVSGVTSLLPSTCYLEGDELKVKNVIRYF